MIRMAIKTLKKYSNHKKRLVRKAASFSINKCYMQSSKGLWTQLIKNEMYFTLIKKIIMILNFNWWYSS